MMDAIKLNVVGIAGVIVSILGLAVTVWKIWKTNIQELQRISDKVSQNELRIAEIDNDFRSQIETVKRDRADRVAAVYNEIETIKRMRETDVRELTAAMSVGIDKATAIEEKHHAEVMAEIKLLTVQLTDMCSTFKEYRRTRNGNNGNKEQ
jgi:hypothetical protein